MSPVPKGTTSSSSTKVSTSSSTTKVSPADHTPGTLASTCQTHSVTNSRGVSLFCRRWEPPGAVRGLVFISHGFSEHLAWYDTLATTLTDHGLLVIGHDHVGHGRSGGARGYIKDASEYREDVVEHVLRVKKEWPNLPCYIIGHSMGGMIAVSSVLRAPKDTFSGAVLMGPLILPDPTEATPARIAAAKVVAWLFPFFPVSKLNEDLVTSDQEMLHKLAKDELRYRGALRAQWAKTCLDEVLENKKVLPSFPVPFLILHGEKDGLCSLAGSQLLYQQAQGVSDKKLKVFPGALHHLYLERSPIRQEALKDTLDWIVSRLPSN